VEIELHAFLTLGRMLGEPRADLDTVVASGELKPGPYHGNYNEY
jgi:hypothetical protein